jgi:hypothetical protein
MAAARVLPLLPACFFTLLPKRICTIYTGSTKAPKVEPSNLWRIIIINLNTILNNTTKNPLLIFTISQFF